MACTFRWFVCVSAFLLPLLCDAGVIPAKRSDDPSPLEVVVQKLTSDLSNLQAKLDAMETKTQSQMGNVDRRIQELEARETQTVAFTAYIGESNLPESTNGVIRFSHSVTNVGNAYDVTGGVFTAPYSGDYMFLVSVDVSSDYTDLTINKNGHWVVHGHNDSGDHHIVTSTVLTLKAGDTVTVNHAGEVKGSVDGGYESIFSGFRIR